MWNLFKKKATAFFNKNECLSVAKKQAWDECKSKIEKGIFTLYIPMYPGFVSKF